LRKRTPAIELRGVELDWVVIEKVPDPESLAPDLRTIGRCGQNSGLISESA
jgi:hypothetical protein